MTNLDLMRLRANTAINDRQQERMIQDKLRSLHRAELYSYQAAWIKKDFSSDGWVKALINPDKIKFDYDEKIVSVDFMYKFKTGDSFEWPKDSGTHWLILKQELTELAYFRGNIRRCQKIEIEDPDTNETLTVWAAIRGPVETQLTTIQKAGLVADVPNLSLNIYVPLTETNCKLFDRYKRFEFHGKYWQVVAMDDISTPNIYEFTAIEDYECHGDELLIEQTDPNPEMEEDDYQITGETFVKPLTANVYSVVAPVATAWSITLPATSNKELDDVLEWSVGTDGKITVKWTAMVSGSYILHYGLLEKTVVVESLF